MKRRRPVAGGERRVMVRQPKLNRHERKRERKIQEFQALLKELGIDDIRQRMFGVGKSGAAPSQARPAPQQEPQQPPCQEELLTMDQVRRKWVGRTQEIDRLAAILTSEEVWGCTWYSVGIPPL